MSLWDNLSLIYKCFISSEKTEHQILADCCLTLPYVVPQIIVFVIFVVVVFPASAVDVIIVADGRDIRSASPSQLNGAFACNANVPKINLDPKKLKD